MNIDRMGVPCGFRVVPEPGKLMRDGVRFAHERPLSTGSLCVIWGAPKAIDFPEPAGFPVCMNARSEALRIIEGLPEDTSMEDIQYHLFVREKIERGLADVAAGRTLNHAEVGERIKQWKSAGPKQQ